MKQLLHSQVVISVRDSTGGIYVPLGNGTFGVPMGEVVYKFTCKQVEVYPRYIPACTRELPVNLGNLSLFLEPISRILVKHPTVIPCSPSMPAKFKSNDHWISAVPEVTNVTSPYLVYNPLNAFLTHESMDVGGLYTESQIREFSTLLTFPKLTRAIKNNFIRSICNKNPHNLCHQYRTTLPFPKNPEHFFYSPIINLKIKLLNFLHDFGEASAILISIYVIFRIIITITGTIFNCFVLQEAPMSRRIIQPCCTTCMINQDYGTRAKQRQRALDDAETIEKAVISGDAVMDPSEQRGIKRKIVNIS